MALISGVNTGTTKCPRYQSTIQPGALETFSTRKFVRKPVTHRASKSNDYLSSSLNF